MRQANHTFGLARLLTILLLCLALPACVSKTVKSTSVPPINSAASPIAEELLLDVDVVIFDPNLDDYDEDLQVYPEVRKAEAHFMPSLLSEAMQSSGAWGAVRVVPDKQQISDLLVEGKILHSNGEELELAITARDSRGYVWLDKTYLGNASRLAYSMNTRLQHDPFQALYHQIANELLDIQQQLRPEDLKNTRLVTELLFAQHFSPDAFQGYLAKNRQGRYLVMRLPAEGDPMLERVRTIRERDHLFIDTMQEHYTLFNGQMIAPYQEWRKLSYDEAVALRELKAESTRRLIAGTIALIAGVAAAGSSDGSARAMSNTAILGGGYLLKSGLEKRNEAEIHVEALDELGQSLEAEITPQVIELQDRTVMLSGSVEDQYAQWRELLAEIYQKEISALALPVDSGDSTDKL